MKNWRFLDTGYEDCYTNMAVDEAMLLEYAAGNTSPTLRIYSWAPPAFSLGHAQDPEKELNLSKCRKEGVPFVRRITGGGVIFHHNELTYSIACSLDDVKDLAFNMRGVPGSKFDVSVRGVYKIICSFLITSYSTLGFDAQFSVDYAKANNLPVPDNHTLAQRRDSFCFASKELYDIVINGKKLGGNAQRRNKNIIFQHGSIPLTLDLNKALSLLKETPPALKNNVCSLEEILASDMPFNEFKVIAKKAFEKTFSLTLSNASLTDREKQSAAELKQNKYTKALWNLYGKK